MDMQPVQGNNFYRIRSIGTGSEILVSQVVLVTIRSFKPGITVYPNPVNNNTIQLQTRDMTAGVYHAMLTNSVGQVLLNKPVTISANTAINALIPATSLLPGIYQLKITSPQKKVTVISIEVQPKL